MLAKAAGSNQFKIGQGDKTWNELEFVSSAESLAGFGLKIEDGKLNVDFSNAPDQMEKFQALLKSIYVPILLTKSTDFYVDGSTGSDVLSTGRGESASLPFKTIQACINYICDNYNLSRYNATILVRCYTDNYGEIIYTENLQLTEFNRSTGLICLYPWENSNTNYNSITRKVKCIYTAAGTSDSTSCAIYGRGGNYHIYGFDFTVKANNSTADHGLTGCLNIGTVLNLFGCSFKIDCKDDHIARLLILVYSTGTNTITYIRPSKFQIELEIIESPNNYTNQIHVIRASSYGQLILNFGPYSMDIDLPILCKINRFDFFAYASSSSALSSAVKTGANVPYLRFEIAPEYSGTGRRYGVYSKATISVGSALGPEYFPGTLEGIVQTSQYAIYS